MKYSIQLSRQALKSMVTIKKIDLKKIQKKIDALSQNPLPQGMEKIKGDNNLFRIRSGDYKFSIAFLMKFFAYSDCVDHGKQVYRDL